MASSTMRRTGRVTVLSACALAMAGLLSAVVHQSWQTNSAAADVVQLEQQGAAILHPLTTLLAELVEAQSDAVRGDPVDTATVRSALEAVAHVDAEHGAALGTRQRLTDLTARVQSAFGRVETGRAAYYTYTGIVTLAVDLIRIVGDTSHLVHDPELDSYYLMDAAIIRLPESMVLAGRASDLVTLAGGEALVGEDAVRAAVARFGVSAAADEVSDGLTKSVDFTNRSELGANIAERLDAFKGAADSFAPPTMLAELSGTVPAATLAANARRVYAAANPLAHRLLSELQALLDERAAILARQWRLTVVATALIVAIGVVVTWMLVRGRRRVAHDAAAAAMPDGSARTAANAVGTLSYAREVLAASQTAAAGTSRSDRSAGTARSSAAPTNTPLTNTAPTNTPPTSTAHADTTGWGVDEVAAGHPGAATRTWTRAGGDAR